MTGVQTCALPIYAPDQDARWEYDTQAMGVGKLAEAYTLVAGVRDYRRIYAYDGIGREASVTTRLDQDYLTATAYDGLGRLARTTYTRNPVGGSGGATVAVDWVYNGLGYPSQLISTQAGSSVTVWQVLAQDAEQSVAREKLGNGTVRQRNVNPYTGRLDAVLIGANDGADGVATPNIQNDAYAYDAVGNLTTRSQVMDANGGLLIETFGYDGLNRLTKIGRAHV